jgi:hypothetical protein
LFTAVCCILLGVFTNRVARQRRVIAAIREVNGNVYYDFHELRPYALDTSRTSGVPFWLLSCFGEDAFHDVIAVDLDSRRVTNAILAEVRHLPAVRRLFISGATITSDGLEVLKDMPSLRHLYIQGAIDDKSMQYVAAIPELELLDIQNAPVTNAGLSQLKGKLRLRRLDLYDTDVTESGITELQRALPNCEILN